MELESGGWGAKDHCVTNDAWQESGAVDLEQRASTGCNGRQLTPVNFDSAAAQLMLNVNRIMHAHKAELSTCVDSWLENQRAVISELQPPVPNGGAPPSAEHLDIAATFHPNAPVHLQRANEPYSSVVPFASANSILSSKDDSVVSVPSNRDKAKTKKKAKKRTQASVLFEEKRNELRAQQSMLQRLVESNYFEWISGSLIMVNCGAIGWETQFVSETANDNAMRNLPQAEKTPGGFVALGAAFVFFFSVDLALRWFAYGFVEFFQTKDVMWNVMDVVVVFFGILDFILEVIGDADWAGGNLIVFRVLRVVRIVRVIRVIRVMKFFRELRIMVYSILGSFKPCLWVVLVLGIIVYVFGICFTTGALAHLDTSDKWRSDGFHTLRSHFGTLDQSILSLFMAMSGGNDWCVYYDALMPLGWHYRIIFLLFISFSLFAVVNIVTGVFVQSALDNNQRDREIVIHEECESKKSYLQNMKSIFEEMDDDDTGYITLDEFERKLQDERVVAYFNVLQLDVTDARTLFTLLDYDHSNEISIDEFLLGCYKLKGESRSLDMKIMQAEVRYLKEAFVNLYDSVRAVRDIVCWKPATSLDE